MFEIIFSYSQNAYIIRVYSIDSTIDPVFIGSLDECEKRLKKCNPWKHNAPYNPQFLGAQPARAGEDY